MAGGEAFTDLQRREIEKAVRDAERVSGYRFSVYVGVADAGARQHAESLHGQLVDPAGSILVHVDPRGRSIEIVTGSRALRDLDNRQAALAVLTMQSAFATGDLTRGLIAGLQQLATLSTRESSLHTDTP